jgi:hypothetical protein
LSAAILYGWLAATSVADAPDWRARDLLFLKSAHDRVLADLERRPALGEGSLLREQQALLRAMTAVARPMEAASIPQDVRPLLASGAASPAEAPPGEAPPGEAPPAEAPRTELLAGVFAVVAAETPVELRIGSNALRVPALDLTGMSLAPDLRAPLGRKVVRPKLPLGKLSPDKRLADKPLADKPLADKPAGARPASVASVAKAASVSAR